MEVIVSKWVKGLLGLGILLVGIPYVLVLGWVIFTAWQIILTEVGII
jgi:hypothetical protein